jgi:hypothetical protein
VLITSKKKMWQAQAGLQVSLLCSVTTCAGAFSRVNVARYYEDVSRTRRCRFQMQGAQLRRDIEVWKQAMPTLQR